MAPPWDSTSALTRDSLTVSLMAEPSASATAVLSGPPMAPSTAAPMDDQKVETSDFPSAARSAPPSVPHSDVS
jgi:hypothetical protein